MVVTAGVVFGMVGPASAGRLGPPPAVIQTGLASFHLNDHIFRPGDRIVATVHINAATCFVPGQCIGRFTWSTPGAGEKGGCPVTQIVPPGNPTLYCRGRARTALSGWTTAGAGFSSSGGGATSDDYYTVVGKKAAIIEGYINNRDGGGVAGTTVEAVPSSLKRSGTVKATSAVDGYYEMEVKPGTYHVVPTGGPTGKKSKSKYKPVGTSIAAKAGKNAHASFTLDAGLELNMHIDAPSVPADGQQVISGTIDVTEYGKPKANATVRLNPLPDLAALARVTTAPHVAICGPSGIAWPKGNLAAPLGNSVDVQTDANGSYKFTLSAGTVPGTWALEAEAIAAKVSADSREVQSVVLTPIGNAGTADFVTALKTYAGSAALASVGDPNAVHDALIKLAVPGSPLAGLTFDNAAGSDGVELLVSPAQSPPSVATDAKISAPSSLVVPFSRWAGASLPTPLASFYEAFQRGRLERVPTFAQWANGDTSVAGWSLVAGSTTSVSRGNFYGFGWGVGTAPGACA